MVPLPFVSVTRHSGESGPMRFPCMTTHLAIMLDKVIDMLVEQTVSSKQTVLASSKHCSVSFFSFPFSRFSSFASGL